MGECNIEIILYSTHCPRCNIIETKLKQKQLNYAEITDIEEMKKLGITSAPYLSVDGKLMDFSEANS